MLMSLSKPSRPPVGVYPTPRQYTDATPDAPAHHTHIPKFPQNLLSTILHTNPACVHYAGRYAATEPVRMVS